MNPYIEITNASIQKFNRAISDYIRDRNKDFSEVIVQRIYNIAGRADSKIPPQNVDLARSKIASYYEEVTATDRAGKPVKRVWQIVNKRAAKYEGKGLYGIAMVKAERRFINRRRKTIGTLRANLKAIHDKLFSLVKYKKWPVSLKGIVVYRRQQEEADIDLEGMHSSRPSVTITMGAYMKNAYVQQGLSMIVNALNKAMEEEANEIYRHLAEILKK